MLEQKIEASLAQLGVLHREGSKRLWLSTAMSFFAGAFNSVLPAELAHLMLSKIVLACDSFDEVHLSPPFDLANYPQSFPAARSNKRHFVIVLGPTNSGKTHEAMEQLSSANTGAYLAPLRLLALEGQERLMDRKVPCDLVTGEERVLVPHAKHVSSTVEMANFSAHYDVAVIDEVQLIEDPYRGRAWVAAVCGLNANLIYLLGSPDVQASLERLIQYMGDSYEVVQKHRLSPLKFVAAQSSSQSYFGVKPGDAFIAFNRADVLYWRDWCKRRGFTTSVVYGSLSPEVRKQEAKRFASGASQVLIATDAIGLGLNLPISRIVFTTIRKFDGTSNRFLSGSEIRQIAGRAGRFGLCSEGEVTALNAADYSRISQALSENPINIAKSKQLSVSPTVAQIEQIAITLHTHSALKSVFSFQAYQSKAGDIFTPSQMKDALALCAITDTFPFLDLRTKLNLSFAPFSRRQTLHGIAFYIWAQALNDGRFIQCPKEPSWLEIGSGEEYLLEAESLSLLCSTYLTLSHKMEAFSEGDKARQLKSRLSAFIEKTLAQASALRVGPCDYSFLLSTMDPETKDYLLNVAADINLDESSNEDFLTKALCRIPSTRQRSLEDAFKSAALSDDWLEILRSAIARALPCLPFYQRSKKGTRLQFLGWFADENTVILSKSSILSWLGAMLKPYPKWRSRLSESNFSRLSADLEVSFKALGFLPVKPVGHSNFFNQVAVDKIVVEHAVILKFSADSHLRQFLPMKPVLQPYYFKKNLQPGGNPTVSPHLDNANLSRLRALGLIK